MNLIELHKAIEASKLESNRLKKLLTFVSPTSGDTVYTLPDTLNERDILDLVGSIHTANIRIKTMIALGKWLEELTTIPDPGQ